MNQIDIHKQIDSILSADTSAADIGVVSGLASTNPDAKEYFFTQANERWLGWLWSNGLLDSIKQKAVDPTTYAYRMPELRYLARMATITPEQVTDILHDVLVGPDTFNPEVVDQFLRICGELPATELVREKDGKNLLEKIRDEKWVLLMQGFNRWGFDYQEIMKTLAEAQEWAGVITIAEAVLSVRPVIEVKQSEYGLLLNSPFYFTNFEHSEVFEYLAKVDQDHEEAALQLLIKTMSAVIAFHARSDDSKTIFPVKDGIILFDLDLFTLAMGEGRRISERDEIRELLATLKVIGERYIYRTGYTAAQMKEAYARTIQLLPDTSAMFKLRLYLLSRRPDVFKDELASSFNRLFTCTDSYYDIMNGTEYLKALKTSFEVVFNPGEQEVYANNVIAFFTQKQTEHSDENWHGSYAGRIFSMIAPYVSAHPELELRITKANFVVEPEYEPTPGMVSGRGGTVHPQGPISAEEFHALSISDIAIKFRTEWTPEELKKRDTDDDFLRPLNGEGAGSLLREDIAKRFAEYIADAGRFFEPEVLNLHYTYCYYRGIEEVLRSNTDVTGVDFKPLFTSFRTLAAYVAAHDIELSRNKRDSGDSWLSGWSGVHMSVTDILHGLLREKEGRLAIDFNTYRSELLSAITYLLGYPDPEPEGEELETARMTVGGNQSQEKQVGDPYSMAINSVRGRAFQALAMFVYLDSKTFDKDTAVRLNEDVMTLYSNTLTKEDTRALYFLYGHYLPTFYFRGSDWTLSHLSQIFPTDPSKYHLYLAAWEGYLAANLFEEIFFTDEIQALYRRGLSVEKELTRRYYRDPDEGLATHMALAIIAYYKTFTVTHPLFEAFWAESDTKQKAEFVRTIGRLYIASDTDRLTEFLEKNADAQEILRNLWDWVIANSDEPEVFAEFGFWMSTKRDIFEKKWLAERIKVTLEKSHGDIEWDHGFTQIVEELVAVAPVEFVSIARSYLLEGAVKQQRYMRPMRYESQWFTVFTTLYKNEETKVATLALINELLEKGGSDYWELKKVIT
jgi:hypothetical protein